MSLEMLQITNQKKMLQRFEYHKFSVSAVQQHNTSVNRPLVIGLPGKYITDIFHLLFLSCKNTDLESDHSWKFKQYLNHILNCQILQKVKVRKLDLIELEVCTMQAFLRKTAYGAVCVYQLFALLENISDCPLQMVSAISFNFLNKIELIMQHK